MPGRYTSSGDYRYGFNGKEKDDEVKGVTGSSHDFGARIYDSRVGRWLSMDRLDNIGWSPYGYAVNDPIRYIDPDGNIQVDAKTGKVIFTPITNNKKGYEEEPIGTGQKDAMARVVKGFIWTNSGNPIVVYKVLSIQNPETGEFVQPDKQDCANCYGAAFANNDYIIPTIGAEGLNKILHDEFDKVGTGKEVGKFEVGDVISFGEDHVIRAMGMENGELIWESHFAMDINVQGNLEDVIKSFPTFLNILPDDLDGSDEALINEHLKTSQVYRVKKSIVTSEGNRVNTNSLGNIRVENGPITNTVIPTKITQEKIKKSRTTINTGGFGIDESPDL